MSSEPAILETDRGDDGPEADAVVSGVLGHAQRDRPRSMGREPWSRRRISAEMHVGPDWFAPHRNRLVRVNDGEFLAVWDQGGPASRYY